MKLIAPFLILFSLSIIGLSYTSAQEHSKREYQKPEVKPMEDFPTAVYPPSWWSGMEMDTIELMIHSPDIKGAEVSIFKEGIEVLSTASVSNPNYLFVKIHIEEDAPTGVYDLMIVVGGDMAIPAQFELLGNKMHQPSPLKASDVMYLIMPDRFANGDPKNDALDEYNETVLNRRDAFKRHGGDLQGIMDHLDYLSDLGVSALWLNPVQENDQPSESYHGYAITDHYEIDRRLGDLDLYKRLVDSCHERGIKMIMDVVLNHCGDQHWFIRDLPDTNWVHIFDQFTKSNFRATTWMDPYGAKQDQDQYVKGWFDTHMPDLDQRNPHLSRFLIQNSIWWVEFAGLDGYRIDTYPYSYLSFSNEWVKTLKREYPRLTLFGETWVHGIPIQAYFSEKGRLFDEGSIAPSLTDFQMHYALKKTLTEKPGWTEGVSSIYYVLAQDFMYEKPEDHIIFLDNHDLNRIWSVVDEDFGKFQMGLTLLMTTRGIPMLYYGTEVLLDGEGGAFGEQGRIDFPGGWKGDEQSFFHSSGRKGRVAQAFELTQKLINLKREHPALSEGTILQYIPENGLYVFFRIFDTERFMIVVNTSKNNIDMQPHKYAEGLADSVEGYDHLSGKKLRLSELILSPGSIHLIELK